MAKDLKIEHPGKRDPTVPEALWLFPERLVALCERDDKDRQQIAVLADRHPAQIGRWLKYQGLNGIAARVLIKLEEGFGLKAGALSSPAPLDLRNNVAAPGVVGDRAEDLELSARKLPVSLCRAAKACIQLTGRSSRDVCTVAVELHDEIGDPPSADPDWWLIKLRDRLAKAYPSGDYPSVRSILAEKSTTERT